MPVQRSCVAWTFRSSAWREAPHQVSPVSRHTSGALFGSFPGLQISCLLGSLLVWKPLCSPPRRSTEQGIVVECPLGILSKSLLVAEKAKAVLSLPVQQALKVLLMMVPCSDHAREVSKILKGLTAVQCADLVLQLQEYLRLMPVGLEF